MNILLVLPVNNLFDPNGESVHILNLCEAWVAHGHSIHVVSLKAKSDDEVFRQSKGLFIHSLPFSISPIDELNFDSLKSILKIPLILISSFLFSLYMIIRNNPDLIFVRYRPPFSSVSLLINILTRKPMITKFAGTAVYDYINLPFEKIIFKRFIQRSRFLIADSSHMVDVFKKEIPKYKLRKIQPPVCFDTPSRYFSKNRRESLSEFIVLYVSSFRKDEDVFNFILASDFVSKKIPGITFKMVGDGATKSAAVRLSKRLNEHKNLLFLGSVPHDQIPNLLSNSDILVALYKPRYRAIPIKILEYAAARKPIITTRNVEDIFEKELNLKCHDFFYSVESDAKSVAEAILKLYEDNSLRDRLANNVSKLVMNFSLDLISQEYIKIFEEATDGLAKKKIADSHQTR